MAPRVELDTSDLERGIRKLGAGLDRAGSRVGLSEAERTASELRGRVPVLTGRLRATVAAAPVRDGGSVTYGGDLGYADYIERRAHAVSETLFGCEQSFESAMVSAAAREVASL